MRVAVYGVGAVGRRVIEALAVDQDVERVAVVHREPARVQSIAATWPAHVTLHEAELAGRIPRAAGSPDVVVIATPRHVRRITRAALAAGSHVVAACDDPAYVRSLLALDARAQAAGCAIAVGTTMAPGLSCVLASSMRGGFERVEEVHVASLGTGGPACARRHHSALADTGVDWSDGRWRRRPGGSGRELVWFPEPVGGADCYRAALSDPLLLMPMFPECRRITARMAATRRDRLTSPLPMMRRPHPEGLVGAVRVEMRGWIDGRADTRILGSTVAAAEAAAAVTTAATRWAAAGRFRRTGSGGLADLVPDPGSFLQALMAAGVTVSEFEGSGAE